MITGSQFGTESGGGDGDAGEVSSVGFGSGGGRADAGCLTVCSVVSVVAHKECSHVCRC